MSKREQVSLTGIPHFLRASFLGMALGWIVVFVPVLIGMTALGAGGRALLYAAHVGFFGGMGFGGMLGAVLQADRFEQSSEWRAHLIPSDVSVGIHNERVDRAA